VLFIEVPHHTPPPLRRNPRWQMHGPCGALNPQCPCMDDGVCTKGFPKDLQAETCFGADGYPLYRRRSHAPLVRQRARGGAPTMPSTPPQRNTTTSWQPVARSAGLHDVFEAPDDDVADVERALGAPVDADEPGSNAVEHDGAGTESFLLQEPNCWVVPYNPALSKKYNAHINVEHCTSLMAIKYITKYIHKGHDRAHVQAGCTQASFLPCSFLDLR